jgi:hypothetical protein
MKHYYKRSRLGSALEAGLIGPVENNIIYEVDDECDTDQEGGIAINSAIVVRDHVIDGVDAKEHDEKTIENLIIRYKIVDLPEDQVFDDPDKAGNEEHNVKCRIPATKQPPIAELPGDDQPFKKKINIDGGQIVAKQLDE